MELGQSEIQIYCLLPSALSIFPRAGLKVGYLYMGSTFFVFIAVDTNIHLKYIITRLLHHFILLGITYIYFIRYNILIEKYANLNNVYSTLFILNTGKSSVKYIPGSDCQ